LPNSLSARWSGRDRLGDAIASSGQGRWSDRGRGQPLPMSYSAGFYRLRKTAREPDCTQCRAVWGEMLEPGPGAMPDREQRARGTAGSASEDTART
jgi:hypothetical protein